MIQVGKGSVPVRSWSAARFPGGSLLLAMAGYGVASCPQGLLSFYADTVRGQLGVGEGTLLVGISFGYADENAPVNRVAAGRAAMKETTTFHAWSRPRKRWSQPLFEGCDQHGRLVSDGEFSYLVATARFRFSRLIPHSTVCRSLWSSLSKTVARPPREPSFLQSRTRSAFSGVVHPILRRRGQDRFARDPQALSARACPASCRRRPGPARGTRMRSRRGWNCGLS